MINLENEKIDLDFFHTILKVIKNNPEIYLDIIDSFSNNQFLSKTRLFYLLDNLNILDNDCEVVIFGCWYGSILIPILSPRVKKIVGIDIDTKSLQIAKNSFFKNYNNVEFITGDVFKNFRNQFRTTSLFINTSCEHMKPMNEWGPKSNFKVPWWNRVKNNAYFAFQSNNMFNIEGHINCVNSIKEFKTQMPLNSNILLEDVISDDRGERYTIIGQIT